MDFSLLDCLHYRRYCDTPRKGTYCVCILQGSGLSYYSHPYTQVEAADGGQLLPNPACSSRLEVYHLGLLIGYRRYLITKDGGTRSVHQCASDGCDMYFSRRSSLLRHQRSSHGLPGGLSCHICGKVAGDKFNLEAHMSSHTRKMDSFLNTSQMETQGDIVQIENQLLF